MPAGNVPQVKQFLIFDAQKSSSVATNVVHKPYNNKLHFQYIWKIKFKIVSHAKNYDVSLSNIASDNQ